ncbi:OprD family outer membrane porin [Marinoscillum pacificum]|uniref:OprD family outer membrane porin n=1 Tax=Marinoscillum pacificum TaxID=392723 RepID=UPI0021576264|nr:OprD family outer membrane porin [Marinoscillum pacificum]
MRYFGIIGLSIVLIANLKAQGKYWGKVSGQWRNYYMASWNKEDLKDFQTLATGGKLKYEYNFKEKPWKVGGAIYTSINLGLQDLDVPDPITGKYSRYETGMYNGNNLSDRFILFPGELYLNYSKGGHMLTLGRMKFVSPFLNPEDGRMIATLEQGLTYKYSNKGFGSFQFGAFNAIAARSSDGFYGIGETIGFYPIGRGVDGKEVNYAGSTESDFLLTGNLDWNVTEKIKINVWEYYADNVFNTTYIKPTLSLSDELAIAGEWLHQFRVGDGGNQYDSLRYFADRTSNVLGAEVSWKAAKKSKFSIGYDRILDGGRFLFPREWGREFLFSFQKRERSEGSSDNHALVFTYDQQIKLGNSNLRSIASVGRHWKADLTNAADNKYAVPDYTHFNLDLFYTHEKLKSLKPELLLVYKMANGTVPDNPNFYFNKVDMFQINFVVNYNF